MGLIVQEERTVNMFCIKLNTSSTRVAIFGARMAFGREVSGIGEGRLV